MHYYKENVAWPFKGGIYDNADKVFRQETKSVSNTNSIAENNFGMLDRPGKNQTLT